MRLRLATTNDIPSIASTAAAAYIDDPQDAYLYPRRHNYPNRYLKLKSELIEQSLKDPNVVIVVAIIEPVGSHWLGNPDISGYCIWYREGKCEKMEATHKNGKRWLSSKWLFLPDSLYQYRVHVLLKIL